MFRTTSFLLISLFCLLGIAGCDDDDDSLSEEKMHELTWKTARPVEQALTMLNNHFDLSEKAISALYLLNLEEGQIEHLCGGGGSYIAQYWKKDISSPHLLMDFTDCKIIGNAFWNLNGSLSLSLEEIEMRGDLLAFKGRLEASNISWAESSYEKANIQYDFTADLTQTITAPNQILTEFTFPNYTRLATEHKWWSQVDLNTPVNHIGLDEMNFQRTENYETGKISVSYQGLISYINGEDVTLSFSTPVAIEKISTKMLAGGELIISDSSKKITLISEESYRYPSVSGETLFNNGDIYNYPYPIDEFLKYHTFPSFSNRNITLFNSSLGLGLDSNDRYDADNKRFVYESLSMHGTDIVLNNEDESILGTASFAVLPMFDNVGEFTVSVYESVFESNNDPDSDRGHWIKTELNSDLYSVALDYIWINITLDSSLDADGHYIIYLTDDSGDLFGRWESRVRK